MKALVICAHPDDEVLGAGGTIGMLTQAGHEVVVSYLSSGVNCRGEEQTPDGDWLSRLLGVSHTISRDLPDNQFDDMSRLDIVRMIEDDLRQHSPQEVYTHSAHDRNIDHVITHDAVEVAVRPFARGGIRAVYCFEALSATRPNDFSPVVFRNIEPVLGLKLEAMERCYGGELRAYPHPRSLEGIRALAQYRGMQSGCGFAEGFEVLWTRE